VIWYEQPREEDQARTEAGEKKEKKKGTGPPPTGPNSAVWNVGGFRNKKRAEKRGRKREN